MIGYTRAARVWAWPEPVDMRAGFDRLFGLVAGAAGLDPVSGDYYYGGGQLGDRRRGYPA